MTRRTLGSVTDGADPRTLTGEEEAEVRRDLRFLLRGAVVLLVVAFVVLAVVAEIGRMPDVELHFAPGWLALAVVGFVIPQIICAEAWRHILAGLGEHLPFMRGNAIWNVSNLARYVPTSMLLFVVRVRLCSSAGVPGQRTIASLVYEVPVMLTGALCVGAWFVVRLPQLESVGAVRWAVFALPIAALVIVHPAVFRPIGDRLARRMGREPLTQLLSFPQVLRFVFLYAIGFVIAGLATYALVAGVYHVDPADLPVIVGAFSAMFVVSVFAFILPGGLGAREVAFAAALAPVLPTSVAVAVAVAVRLLQMGIEVLLAVATPLIAQRVDSRRNAAVGEGTAGVPLPLEQKGSRGAVTR
jgi:uncharacterized membrane protein YbhN (UPF0104 family)